MRPGGHVFQIYRTGDNDLLHWRLISSNGRVLGCTTSPARTLADAQASIATVVGSADSLVATLRLSPDHRWLWTLSLDEQSVVRGAASHDRHVRCELAWRRFVLAAPLARLDDEVHAFRTGLHPAPVEASPIRHREIL